MFYHRKRPAGQFWRHFLFRDLLLNKQPSPLSRLFGATASSKLALALVLILILFSAVGTVLPQHGRIEIQKINQWQAAHPVVSTLVKPVGFFRVFHSWPFLVTIFILAVNTLSCTLLRFIKEGKTAALRGPGALRMTGFLALHLSIILLLIGSGITSATKMKARIILTEGQAFIEKHSDYPQIVEGFLRPERHTHAEIRLKNVDIQYEQGHPVAVTSSVDIRAPGRSPLHGDIRVNDPLKYQGIIFTQDRTGFSPRVRINRTSGGRPLLVDSFVSLQTFDTPDGKTYQDFLALPFVLEQFIFTVYPDHVLEGGRARKTGDADENPLLLIEVQDKAGRTMVRGHVPLGGEVELGEYRFAFPALRQWSSLMLVEDPGYLVVAVSLWLGLGAMVLRYVPVLEKWFRGGDPGTTA